MGNEERHQAAQTMLESFGRSGATRFDLTITDAKGDKVRYRRGVHLRDLGREMPTIIDEAEIKGENVIVRPQGPGMTFVQLDDLDKDRLARVLPIAFLAIETSPGSFQAWIALSERSIDESLPRRLKRGVGADLNASGAARVAGSRNFKPKHAPDFPVVMTVHADPGKITTQNEITALGLVAPEEALAAPPRGPTPGRSPKRWPDYRRCLDGAPLNHDQTGPDVSRADFAWCMTAIGWGFGVEEVASRLMEESRKAQTNGARYALATARNAAAVKEKGMRGR